MKPCSERIIEVFNEAKALAAGVERERFIAEACRDDPELEQQVASLLEFHDDAGDFLGRTAFPVPTSPSPHQPGDRIGRYKLLEQIGEGGCGVVYLAEQEEPVRRRVALKVIRLGMDTKSVIARFEGERQALALMDHPNIAKVFDAGATENGRPYFVMELVRGVKITDFCDQNNLPTAERLELFSKVCHAIQHAHQKGVIHRDIKPSNILVTISEPGAPGCPRVIDFGIAKATSEQRLTDKTVYTAIEQFIGTPAYMSPEQAMMTSIDVDTRTDVYALGVLLYELLTGCMPFDIGELMDAGLDAMRRIIREREPARPSTRLSTLQAPDLTEVARNRHAEPARLSHLLRGDLDWIVMKCLEKERGRRYQSASDVASDLQRHLKGEPVLACPPSVAYRFRKFARRNKAVLAMVSVLALAAVVTVAGLLISNQRVRRERDDKEVALLHARQETARADQNLAKAREAVKEYLLQISESPLLQTGDFQPLRKELMESAIPFLEEFASQDQDDPVLEFERGRAYDDLGFLREGIGDQERALADLEQAQLIYRRLAGRFPDDPAYPLRLAEALNTRAGILKDLSQLDAAEAEFRQALDLVTPLRSGSAVAPEAVESHARILSNLGLLLKESGRLPEAETLLREAVTTRERLLQQESASFPRRGQLAMSLNNLGAVLAAQRKTAEAESVFEKILELLRLERMSRTPGNSSDYSKVQHWRAQAWNNLGMMRNAAGRPTDAEKAYREALVIKREMAERFPSIVQYRQELASSLNNLGAVISSLGRPDDARIAYEEAIRIYERMAIEIPDDPRHVVTLAGTYSNLGRLIGDGGQLEESLLWVTKGIEILEASMRRDPRVAKVRESLCIASWARAMTLCGLNRFEVALKDWDRAIELDDGHHQQELRLKRASNLLNVKDHLRATADANALADFPTATAEDLYNAACVYSHCTRLAEDDPPRAESYSGKAVLLLRQALANGYDDLARIKTHPDLHALRIREDFQQLIKESEAGPGK